MPACAFCLAAFENPASRMRLVTHSRLSSQGTDHASIFCASILAALLIAASFAQPADAKEFNLKVVDEQGQPVPKFEAMIYSGTGLRWSSGENGTVSLTAEQLPPTVRVIVPRRRLRFDGAAIRRRRAGETAAQSCIHHALPRQRSEAAVAPARGNDVAERRHARACTSPRGQQVVQNAGSAEGRQMVCRSQWR